MVHIVRYTYRNLLWLLVQYYGTNTKKQQLSADHYISVKHFGFPVDFE